MLCSHYNIHGDAFHIVFLKMLEQQYHLMGTTLSNKRIHTTIIISGHAQKINCHLKMDLNKWTQIDSPTHDM